MTKSISLPEIIVFAIDAHTSTNHLYDGHPYSVHLAMVSYYASRYFKGTEEEKLVVFSSCWLHDTIEDCRLTYNDVKAVAGEEVAEIVYALTNDKGRNRGDRAGDSYYKGIRETKWATFVKLCDRLANVKYGIDTKSKMVDTYRKENKKFLSMLGLSEDSSEYGDMIIELNRLLEIVD